MAVYKAFKGVSGVTSQPDVRYPAPSPIPVNKVPVVIAGASSLVGDLGSLFVVPAGKKLIVDSANIILFINKFIGNDDTEAYLVFASPDGDSIVPFFWGYLNCLNSDKFRNFIFPNGLILEEGAVLTGYLDIFGGAEFKWVITGTLVDKGEPVTQYYRSYT